MVQKPKAVKYKVIIGYVLLIAVVGVTVWFAYSEILKIARPSDLANDNARIIRLSNTLNTIYEADALGRSAILSNNNRELSKFNQLTDSIAEEIELIKSHATPEQQQKFDSIQVLLQRKRSSVKEVTDFHKKYGYEQLFEYAINSVYGTRQKVWENTKPVKNTKNYEWNKTVESLLTPKQIDSLSRLDVSNDSLAIAFNNTLANIKKSNDRAAIQLYRKEQKLLEENRVISDKLRNILSSIEKEFVQKSYLQVTKTQTTLNNTITMVARVGAVTLLCLIILGSIIVRDLGINQNYRRQLESLNNENEELLRTKSMLMATVTHDLQTPLGSIIGFHNLLKDSGVNENQKQYLANIKESANYIMKLVNDLLDFSRLENNRITIEHIPFNLKSAIEATCSTLLPMAESKGIELNWDIDDTLDRYCLSDPYRIKQVLTNLISNAVKFTNEGSVEITAKVDSFDIQISVLDTGIGIAPDKHHLVFKEFTQAHEGIEKKFGGTGLGLTISKRIIELLGGTITLESEEGKGSIFTITLPCVAAKNIPEVQETEPESFNLSELKILVTDDDVTQLKLMKEVLGKTGATVIIENNSLNVVKRVREENVNLVLTDVQMPVMDGFELLEALRENFGTRLPVVALSGRRDLTDDYFAENGFTASLPKPVDVNELVYLIAHITGHAGKNFELPKTENKIAMNEDKIFDLTSLSQFTQNDSDSLRLIVQTFIESSDDNCEELLLAARNNDIDELAKVAHRMIPMLKQMEVHGVVNMLLPLEDKTLKLTPDELLQYCKDISHKMDELCEMLENEIA